MFKRDPRSEASQRLGRMILSQSHRSWHGANPPRQFERPAKRSTYWADGGQGTQRRPRVGSRGVARRYYISPRKRPRRHRARAPAPRRSEVLTNQGGFRVRGNCRYFNDLAGLTQSALEISFGLRRRSGCDARQSLATKIPFPKSTDGISRPGRAPSGFRCDDYDGRCSSGRLPLRRAEAGFLDVHRRSAMSALRRRLPPPP
jgi:hypothetical protein